MPAKGPMGKDGNMCPNMCPTMCGKEALTGMAAQCPICACPPKDQWARMVICVPICALLCVARTKCTAGEAWMTITV